MLERDLLEVTFLLDYFRTNEASIAEWRGCTESERNKKFGAYKVRTALDDRDGFTEQKREERYKRLCTLLVCGVYSAATTGLGRRTRK
jgi:hypothetical protein